MARIKGDLPFVKTQHGSYEKGHKGDTRIVVRTVYGNSYASPVTYSDADPTPAQIMAQARFASASTKAAQDMLNPEKKAEWQAVADASHGKYKTARGAAFASYYNQESTGD